ncbi:hypothetical protein PIB30_115054, partial [Stylosanthes scabra]|nr:hypothetical protein [Stylosanthes scabra]
IQRLQIVTVSQQGRDPTESISPTTFQTEFPQRKASFRKSTQGLIRYIRTRQIKKSQKLQTHQCINELQCHNAQNCQRPQLGSLANSIGNIYLNIYLTSREL